MFSALADPQRRDRAAALLILGFVALWTLYGVLAKGSQGIHFDMGELADLARHPALGNAKNPPFAIWLAGLWFAIFPRADWAFYLLSMTGVGVALWAAWRLFGRYLDGEKRIAGLVLLSFIPLLTFHPLKFNNNALMIPLWALATWCFIRSFEDRRLLAAALAGVFAACALLTKYWSVFLIAALARAALADRRRGDYFRSAAPWITALSGALVLAPHVLWLYVNNFPSFGYALAVHGGRGLSGSAQSVAGYLGGIAGYAAIPVALTVALAWPLRADWRDVLWPDDAPRRFAVIAFWAGLLLPIPVAFATGSEIVSLWSMPAFTLLPVVLLSSPRLALPPAAARRLLGLAIIVPVVAVMAAPGIAYFIHRNGGAGMAGYLRPLAANVERAWRATTAQPLRYVGGYGDLAYGVAFYLTPTPTAFPDFNRRLAPFVEPAEVARDGIVLICPVEEEGCVAQIKGYAANFPRFSIDEVAAVNRFLGSDGPPRRFVIVIVAPQNALAAVGRPL